ncbi:MAG: hypothetical protein DRG78_00885 [Epsilonproteobacteria bacterium]|nr:MAG: hypothetical protein DRG78_00885 [Campylobacterota bacterium]
MNCKVKELFNILYSDENKEQKTNPNSKLVKKRKPFTFDGKKYSVGTRIHIDLHAEEYMKYFSDETYFIICPDNDIFFPTEWDELEINYSNINVRYCRQCNKDIYKVDNEYLYKQCKEEYLCMAISTDALNKLKNNIENNEYERLTNIILVSKLFFIYENLKFHEQKEFYEIFKENNFTRELAFKTIILDIINSNNIEQTIEYYTENGVDLDRILFQIVPTIEDTKLKERVEEKIMKIIKKDKS